MLGGDLRRQVAGGKGGGIGGMGLDSELVDDDADATSRAGSDERRLRASDPRGYAGGGVERREPRR